MRTPAPGRGVSLARLAAGAAGQTHGALVVDFRDRARQVIKEVDDALQGWHTGGRFKDQGILEQARPPAGPPARRARRRERGGRAVTFCGCAAQVASADHRWAY